MKLFFQELKHAISEENSRRLSSGIALITNYVNAIEAVFNDAIAKMKTDNAEFEPVKDAFLRSHQQIRFVPPNLTRYKRSLASCQHE